MSQHRTDEFAAKHGDEAAVDPLIKAEIKKRIKGPELPCALAFEIAKTLEVTPQAIGKTADLMNLRLVKCQLGLFGYGPEKKIVRAQTCDNDRLGAAIEAAMADGRVSCRQAWDIAAGLNLRKLTVSGVCEGMNLKVKPCQLGAF